MAHSLALFETFMAHFGLCLAEFRSALDQGFHHIEDIGPPALTIQEDEYLGLAEQRIMQVSISFSRKSVVFQTNSSVLGWNASTNDDQFP